MVKMKKRNIKLEKISKGLVGLIIISLLLISVFSVDAIENSYNPIPFELKPWVDHEVTLDEDEYQEKIVTSMYQDLYYLGEIQTFRSDFPTWRLIITVSSILKNPCNVEIKCGVPIAGYHTNYKIEYDRLLFTQDVIFEEDKIFVNSAEEVDMNPSSVILTGFNEEYETLRGFDATKNHWFHINTPKNDNSEPLELEPGYYAYKLNIKADGAFQPLFKKIGCEGYEKDLYISFGYRLSEILPPDDDDGGDDDGDEQTRFIQYEKLICLNNKIIDKIIKFTQLITKFFFIGVK
jgi:hypothetical protein